jgi:hypothetical protein
MMLPTGVASSTMIGKDRAMDAPPFDEHLWFTAAYCPERHYLLDANPFTFHGRMRAWCPDKGVAYNISKGEIETCSEATRYWVRGYLAGNTHEPPRDADGDWLPEDDPATERWRRAAALFLITGIWRAGDPVPCSECGEDLLPSQPGLVCIACIARTDA